MQAQLICLLGLAIVCSQGNLSTEKTVVEEAFKYDLMNFPEGDSGGYPGLVSSKTNFLLEEAENMLNRVKVVKERIWLQTFIFKMRILVAMVKQSINAKVAQENEESIEENLKESTSLNFASIIQFIKQSSSANRDDTKISHLTTNIQSAEEQETVTMSNHQELKSTTGQYHTHKQDFQKIRQEDELARKLEELPHLTAVEHSKRRDLMKTVKPSYLMTVYEATYESIEENLKKSTSQNFLSMIRSVKESSSVNRDDSEISHLTSNVQSTEEQETVTAPNHQELDSTTGQYKQDFQKIRQEDVLVRELEELPHLAAEEHSKRRGMMKTVKPSYLMAVYEAANEIGKRKIEMELGREILELKKLGSSPYEIELALGLDDPSTLKLIRLKMRTHENQRNPWKINFPTNTSLEEKHIFPVKEHKLQNEQHRISLPPSIRNLLKQKENYLLKQTIRSDNLDQVKGSRRQYHPDLAQNSPNTYNANQIILRRNLYGIKNLFTPTNNNAEHFTPTNNNAEFSDEIKRELRDGKVILLSHSVVPSNFETGKDAIPTQSDVKIEVHVQN